MVERIEATRRCGRAVGSAAACGPTSTGWLQPARHRFRRVFVPNQPRGGSVWHMEALLRPFDMGVASFFFLDASLYSIEPSGIGCACVCVCARACVCLF